MSFDITKNNKHTKTDDNHNIIEIIKNEDKNAADTSVSKEQRLKLIASGYVNMDTCSSSLSQYDGNEIRTTSMTIRKTCFYLKKDICMQINSK